jgi:ADP-ribose pyrophosphatase
MNTTLLTTRRFSVERREYPRAGGRSIVRDVVMLPILDRDRIVMIRNYRHSVERELLELPAGTREPGEEPVDTAARELEEETGYRAKRLSALTEFYTSPGILSERMFAFLAEELTMVDARPEEGEIISVQITPLDTIKRMIVEGTLLDGKTIAVLASYLLRQGYGSGR